MATETGRVVKIGPIVQGVSKSGNPWQRRDLVLVRTYTDRTTGEVKEMDWNTPKFTFFGDKAALLDGIREGMTVTVHYDLNGKKWTRPNGEEDIITSAMGWKVEPAGQSQGYLAAPQQITQFAQAPQYAQASLAEMLMPPADQRPQKPEPVAGVDELPF